MTKAEKRETEPEGRVVSGYVVYFREHLRDGREEHAKAFDSLEKAIAFINEVANGYGGATYSFRMFELGKEVPIRSVNEETPQPPVIKTRYEVGP